MEEWVGELWHKMITRMADRRFPQAAVELAQLRPTLGLFFRALGGDGGLQIEAADATANTSYRSWVQRLAGANTRTQLAWRDERALRLPPSIACFDQTGLNRDLYFWLTALGACAHQYEEPAAGWFIDNQWFTQRVLRDYPGLEPRYRRLAEHHLAQRPDPASLASANWIGRSPSKPVSSTAWTPLCETSQPSPERVSCTSMTPSIRQAASLTDSANSSVAASTATSGVLAKISFLSSA